MSQPDVSSSSTAQDLLSVNALHAIYADKQVGECFEFGRYPQKANGDEEPITWRVLRRNADYLLVIAERGLDCRPYDNYKRKAVWENCALRRWLNTAFYDTAFNEQERKCILKTGIVNNASRETEDRIFLLSVDEARNLFANDDERRAKPTGYAVRNCLYENEYGYCCWWLSCRGDGSNAAVVRVDGGVDCCGISVRSESISVRPAFKIALVAPAPSQPAAPPLCSIYADKEEGECFEFGRYPQGANGEIEPITWRVLQRFADHLLVIAEQGLDCKPYNENLCEITWADCSLRRWLNSEFYNMAFNEQERKCILQTIIVNNAGPKTEDRIFLLSVKEVRYLFENVIECCAKPTEYAVKNGVYKYKNCCWWLRSRGHNYGAVYVRTGGFIYYRGSKVNSDYYAVRPAFKIALNAPAPSQPSALSKPAVASAPSVPSLRTIYANKQVGECFEFGRYPQGANGEIEPITWRVLRRKADYHYLLVLAEKGLDSMQYTENNWGDARWDDCTLRRWLNSEFYDKAFSEQERESILQTRIGNHPGRNTEDRVFLLSVDEAENLFANDDERRAEPTEFATIFGGVFTFKSVYCWWWLRSRGYIYSEAACVTPNGAVSRDGLTANYGGLAVRPAIKIDLTEPVPSQPSALPKLVATPTPFQTTDSSKQDVPSLRETYANKQVGECFEFGCYPQGANGDEEPIIWRVLRREANHLLAISEQGLDCRQYNEEDGDITWAGCSLRRWLNSWFYGWAFDEQERKCILSTGIVNNADRETEDRIFLLSVDEARNLFADDNERRAKSTKYTTKNGAYTNRDGYCWWWLRSRGDCDDYAAYVSADGGVFDFGYDVDYGDGAVRPAIKLAL